MNALQIGASISLILIAGAGLVLLPYAARAANRGTPAFHPHSRLGRLERRWVGLRHWLNVRLRLPELGGYVHDTAMSVFIPPAVLHYVTGTWTDAAGAVSGTIVKAKAAADNTAVVNIPVCLPQNSVAQKGSFLKSIDLWYNVTTAALDAASVTAVINRFVLPANGAAFPAAVTHAFTYDTGNDTAAEADDLDEHKMTLTITTPFWMDDDDFVTVAVTIDAAATSVVHIHGARANFTLRL
jgi:hypothetical protein